jgi:hypothetical protein
MLVVNMTFTRQVADPEYMIPDVLLIKLKSVFLFVSERYHMPLAYEDMYLNKTVPI